MNLQELLEQQTGDSKFSKYKLPPLNEEQKKQISERHRGKVVSAETRAKLAIASANRVTSDETRAKQSETRKGKKWSNGSTGMHWKLSDETRARQSAARCKPVMTPNGVFKSWRAVAQVAGVSEAIVKKWRKKYPEHYYYLHEKKEQL